jgi:hypothetical protein
MDDAIGFGRRLPNIGIRRGDRRKEDELRNDDDADNSAVDGPSLASRHLGAPCRRGRISSARPGRIAGASRGVNLTSVGGGRVGGRTIIGRRRYRRHEKQRGGRGAGERRGGFWGDSAAGARGVGNNGANRARDIVGFGDAPHSRGRAATCRAFAATARSFAAGWRAGAAGGRDGAGDCRAGAAGVRGCAACWRAGPAGRRDGAAAVRASAASRRARPATRRARPDGRYGPSQRYFPHKLTRSHDASMCNEPRRMNMFSAAVFAVGR